MRQVLYSVEAVALFENSVQRFDTWGERERWIRRQKSNYVFEAVRILESVRTA